MHPQDGMALKPKWNETVGVELYDHTGDTGMAPMAFDDFENVNLAGKAEWAAVEADLRGRLEALVAKYMSPWTPHGPDSN